MFGNISWLWLFVGVVAGFLVVPRIMGAIR